ncbi:protein hu-li tai shao isoform X1 [Hermetia illucens]|uniref:protein hu-li tai shao isoform X1 n=1 Tax=Hermetia illucens TaxID=343691 RepID=UPI0018CC119F|nr:protein hu-li tai shao isoform X1 [Hermetia illucens]XP_037916924.1 protein hu-li tai shao isoform X1 [Hermetia illucens]
MTEVEQPSQNGLDVTLDEDENNKSRPADIEADMREMERRKRVEAIMGSKLFREELERIVDAHRDGGPSGILQQLSEMVGVPASRIGNIFKSSNCVLPINDIRGVESMGYEKGEKILRCKLAATFRLLDLYGWTQGLGAQITARLNADQELFLVNPFGLMYHEVTASSLNKADMQGFVVEQGTTNFGINTTHYVLHSVVHAARPDIRCIIYIGCNPVVAVSSLKVGILPLTKDSAVLGEIATHAYTGSLHEPEERQKLVRSLGPISKVLLLSNHGALCCGETIEEAFYAAYHIVQACETQLKLLPVGLDNLVLLSEEARKAIYDASRKPPEGFEQPKTADDQQSQQQQDNKEKPRQQKIKWRVGGAEFEALMRMLDNGGFRTGYIYRNPLVKSDLPKPKNDVEVPPAVSSLGYLLEEEELYRQGVWKKSDLRKGGDRTRWLNSPNVYQKVEVLETGTPDPKKITKWVADGSPTHSTPVRIENALQFVPPGTNPKEFKKLQQLIKDNRRADKISAGPQSHILEGVTWDEANNRIKDATVSASGDTVVLMGAASKGIIQRGYQHNATVYKAPYAKNPFDSVTDDELNEYKKTVERKRIHGEYTDTDFSESEALSSQLTSGTQQKSSAQNVPSQSETEDASEPQVLRIETKQAPKPSQPEVVLSDANVDFLNSERAHTTSKKPPTGRGENVQNGDHSETHLSTFSHSSKEDVSTEGSPKKDKKKKKGLRTPSFLKKKKEKKKVEA